MAIVHQSTEHARVAAQKSADNGTGDRGAQVDGRGATSPRDAVSFVDAMQSQLLLEATAVTAIQTLC